MSGRTMASYVVTSEQRARMREVTRQQEIRRHWRLLQAERERLRADLTTLGIAAPRVEALGDLPSLTSDALVRAITVAKTETRAMRRQLDDQVTRGRQRFADDWATGSAEALAARKETGRVLSQLDSAVEVTPAMTGLLAQLAQEPGPRRAQLLASLLNLVRQVNATTRRRRAALAVLTEIEVAVRETGDAALRTILDNARAAYAADRPVDVATLRAALASADLRQAVAEERAFVQDTVVKAFQCLGYEVVAGTDAVAPGPGVLVRRSDAGAHAVRVAMEADRIAVASVRLSAVDGTAGTAPRGRCERDEDERAAEVLCRQTPRVWELLAIAGIQVGQVRVEPLPAPAPPTVTSRWTEPARRQIPAGRNVLWPKLSRPRAGA